MLKLANASVLVVEDTQSLASLYAGHLKANNISSECVYTGAEALEKIREQTYPVILLDLQLPDIDGFEILTEIQKSDVATKVIVATADGSLDRIVTAMRLGAHDYLVKPIRPARLGVTVRNALELVRLADEISHRQGDASRRGFYSFVGSSKPMQLVYSAIENVADSKATVFITGESGTGKEVCAEAIHKAGGREKGPFVAINCGAIPHDLMESEIFGHLRGSFTGAVSNRDGAATLASGGTLFLDEICEMDLSLQTKLLRFLQTGMIQRVGSNRTEKVDVRVVCATNRNPAKEVAEGRFREDLYYRLNVIPIHMPPLRERGDDVVDVALALLGRFSEEEGKSFKRINESAAKAMLTYSWPGNVRELQNVIRRVVVMHDAEEVDASMLPNSVREQIANELSVSDAEPAFDIVESEREFDPMMDGETWVPHNAKLADMERIIIETTVKRCGGSLPEAARLLGVSPSTLYRKRAAWDNNEALSA